MILKIRFHSFDLLALVSILVLSLSLYSFQIISINAQSSDEKPNKKEDKNDDDGDLTTTIKTKINLTGIDVEKHDRLKLVSYLNGEGKTTYVDLKENKNKINLNDNSLTVNLKFNKSNDISQVMFDDEYYVCGYVIDNEKSDTTSKSNLSLFDCDEGNIGLTSTDKDTVKLFYTLKKFSKSNTLYKTQNTSPSSNIKEDTTNEVVLRIDVPIQDNKKINDMYVVAMIKGEYQIKKIDAQNEREKEGNKKSTSERLSIPFTFDRNTEVGLIEPGDMFFGCVTSDEFPDQNSDCEKRIITDLSKQGQLCARKDSTCK